MNKRATVEAQESTSSDDRRLRLLFLLAYTPSTEAINGSGRAIAHLLLALSARHQVAVLYLRAPDEQHIDNNLRAQCVYTREIPRAALSNKPLTQWRQRMRLLAGILKGKPFWVTDWSVNAFGRACRSLLKEWQPDIIQLEWHVMGQYLPALTCSSAPRVLVQHEAAVRAAPYVRTMHPVVNNILQRLDEWAWRRFDSALMSQVHAVVALTEEDRQALYPLAQETPIVRIPIGASVGPPLNPIGDRPASLLFIGNYQHAPNVDAAVRLINNIFPAIHAHYPDTILNIVGTNPPSALKQLAGDRVVVTGRVPDLNPYLDSASIVVVPLRLGGGMRVKVLEAMAAGKAVVASPLALEGLDIQDGKQVRVAASDDAFITAILELLHDTKKRKRLAEEAHRWAYANLSWARSAAAYNQLYESLLHDSHGANPPSRRRLQTAGSHGIP